MKTIQLKTVTKAMDVIAKIAYSDAPWGPREIARELNIDKSSSQRILQTLRQKEMLSYDEAAGKYTCGPNLKKLAIALQSKNEFSRIASPIIENYVQKIDENIALFSYHDGKVMYELVVDAGHVLTSHPKLGVSCEICFGSSGRVALANIPDQEVELLYRHFAERNLCDIQALKMQVRDAGKKGYAVSYGERVLGIVSFSAAVFGANDIFKGGVTLALPDVRYDPEAHEKLGKTIVECAAEISTAYHRCR